MSDVREEPLASRSASEFPRRTALLIAASGTPAAAALSQVADALATALPHEWCVTTVVRDGRATIHEALKARSAGDTRDLVVVPLHPQFSSVTTGAIIRDVYGALQDEGRHLNVAVRPAWYDDAGYINALARRTAEVVANRNLQPETTQLRFIAPDLSLDGDGADDGYASQMRETAMLVAARLGWPQDRWSVSLEGPSRRTPTPDHRAGTQDGRAAKAAVLVCSLPFPGDGAGSDRVHVCPSAWAYEPLVSALRNLVLHGPCA
jgi:protoheme ferro-lyase